MSTNVSVGLNQNAPMVPVVIGWDMISGMVTIGVSIHGTGGIQTIWIGSVLLFGLDFLMIASIIEMGNMRKINCLSRGDHK